MLSVIIPTIGRGSLQKTIKSVRRVLAIYPDVQILIVDNSESGLDISIAQAAYENRCEIYRIDQTLDVASARNFGVSRATFNWLYFLDDDDEMQDLPDSINRNFLGSTTHNFLLFSALENGCSKPDWTHYKFKGFRQISALNVIPIGSFLINKKITPDFDAKLKTHEDYEFLLRVFCNVNLDCKSYGDVIVNINTTSSVSRSRSQMHQWGIDLSLIYSRYPCIESELLREKILNNLVSN